MEEKTKKRGWVKDAAIVFLAVLLVLTFFSSTILNRSLPEVATEYVQDGTITTKVRGTGTVVAKENYDVTIDQTRKVDTVLVRVGDEVAVGDTLFILQPGDSTELDAAKENLANLEEQYQRMLLNASEADYAQEDRNIAKARTALTELRLKAAELLISDAERLNFNKAYAALLEQAEGYNQQIATIQKEIEAIDLLFGEGSKDLNQRIWELKDVVTEKEAIVKEKEAVVTEKEAVVKEKEAIVEGKKAIVAEKEEGVAEKEDIVATKQEGVEEKQAIVEEKQQVVAELQEALAELQEITAGKRKIQSEREAERDALQAQWNEIQQSMGSPGDMNYDRLESASAQLDDASAALKRAQQELETQKVLHGDNYALLEAEANAMMEAKFRAERGIGEDEELDIQQSAQLSYFVSNNIAVYLPAAAQQHTGDALGDAYTAITNAESAVESAQRAYNSAMSQYDNAYHDYVQQNQNNTEYQKKKKELDAKQKEIDAAQAIVDAAASVVKQALADEEAQEKLISAAEKEVKAAEKEVTAAQKLVTAAEKDVAAAQKLVDAAKKDVEAAQKDVEAAQALVNAAQQDVNEAQNAVAQAQQDVANAQSALSAWESRDKFSLRPEESEKAERQKELQEQQDVLRQKAEQAKEDAEKLKTEIENREAEYKTAKAAVESQQETLEDMLFNLEQQKKNDDTSQKLEALDRKKVLDSIEKQKAEIEELSGDDGGIEVKARVAGTIQSVSVSSGHPAQAGAVLATIEVPDLGYTLKFSVTNDQARRLHVGDTSTVSNYYWGSQIDATLISIQTDPQNPQGSKVLTFDVTGDVTAGSSLTLSVGEKNANYDMVVPNSAIRTDVNGSFVLKVTAKNSPLGNRYYATRVDVDIVASDEKYSAISGGIESYDSVITTASKNAPISAGDQVRLADTNT